MAQEIVTWCDVHLDRDERVAGSPRQVALMGQSTKVLDLCEDCAKEILGAVLDALEAYGRSPKAPPGAGKQGSKKKQQGSQRSEAQQGLVCPVPDCEEDRVFFDRNSVRGHVQHMHDEVLAVLEAEAGQTVEGFPVEYMCEEPGCGAGFATPQGRGAHASHRHGHGARSAA